MTAGVDFTATNVEDGEMTRQGGLLALIIFSLVPFISATDDKDVLTPSDKLLGMLGDQPIRWSTENVRYTHDHCRPLLLARLYILCAILLFRFYCMYVCITL